MATQTTDVTAEVVEQQGHESSIEEPKLQAEQPQETDADRNWKQMRQKLDEQDRQLKLSQERERHYQDQLAKQAKPQEEEEDHLNPDDILTVAQAKKLAAKEAQRLFRQQQEAQGEERARKEFTDYDAVVTRENLERLAREKPQLMEAVTANSTLYGKATTAYAFLKSMIGSPEQQDAQARVARNASKPASALSAAPSKPLHQAHNFERGLTPDIAKALQREMQEAIRQRN